MKTWHSKPELRWFPRPWGLAVLAPARDDPERDRIDVQAKAQFLTNWQNVPYHLDSARALFILGSSLVDGQRDLPRAT